MTERDVPRAPLPMTGEGGRWRRRATAAGSTTPGMVGADLANLANEAALLAARRGNDTLVDSGNDDRPPLLFIAGGADHIVR
jgi:hypothetical protein